MTDVRLTRWSSADALSDSRLEAILREEGLRPSWWSNSPGDRYSAHQHTYHKVLYCARGSIRFDVGSEAFELHSGDRLEIPPGTSHSAVVGQEGVRCVEAARSE
jgi:quercetin dioxygenase-like cupin family protein